MKAHTEYHMCFHMLYDEKEKKRKKVNKIKIRKKLDPWHGKYGVRHMSVYVIPSGRMSRCGWVDVFIQYVKKRGGGRRKQFTLPSQPVDQSWV